MEKVFLPAELRRTIIDHLVMEMIERAFGDGEEKNFCLEGFPKFRGYLNYTDEELVLELLGIGPTACL